MNWEYVLRRNGGLVHCREYVLVQFALGLVWYNSKSFIESISQKPGYLKFFPIPMTDVTDVMHQVVMWVICSLCAHYYRIIGLIILQLCPRCQENINPSPDVAIFGVPKIWSKFNYKQLDVLAFTSLIARRRILLHWKSNKPPTTSQWLVDTMHFLKLEKVRCSGKTNFFKKWQCFITYFNSLKVLPSI